MKPFPLRPLVVAAALAMTGAARAADDGPSMFSFRGFGTVAAVHSSTEEADFTGTIFQPSGAGKTRNPSFDPDSKLGAQVNAKFTSSLSGVVQVLSQQQWDNSYKPAIEWANLSYEFTPAFRARVGRIALPAFLISETRYVGFANTWVRPPQLLYLLAPVTSNDGVDASYQETFGEAVNTTQAFYGSNKVHRPMGTVNSDPSWGINNTLEIGATTLRVGFISTKLNAEGSRLDALMAGLRGFAANAALSPSPAVQAAGVQASTLAVKYDPANIQMKTYTVGVSHDTGEWLMMAEYAYRDANDGVFAPSYGWYASVGHRMGNFTPYVTVGNSKTDVQYSSGISTAGLPGPVAGGAAGLSAGLRGAQKALAVDEKLMSVGLRWDAVKNVAIKAQFDQIHLGENSVSRFANASPTASMRGGKVNLVTLGVDFLF